VRCAVLGFAGAMMSSVLLNLAGVDRLVPLVGLMFVGFGCLGLVMPATAVLALDRHGAIAGTASALMGTCQFLLGATMMALVGWFVDGSSRPMVLGIGLCAALAFLLTWFTLRPKRRRPAHAPGIRGQLAGRDSGASLSVGGGGGDVLHTVTGPGFNAAGHCFCCACSGSVKFSGGSHNSITPARAVSEGGRLRSRTAGASGRMIQGAPT